MSHFISKKQKGFTLVEVLMAVSIFSIAITGVITVSAQGGLNVRRSEFRLTANYLMNEGIELMRGVRDNQVLYHTALSSDPEAPHAGWRDFRDSILTQCTATVPCDVDTLNAAGTSDNFPSFANVSPCVSGYCDLYYDNSSPYSSGYYNDQGVGRKTVYSRAITATAVNDDELTITVVVRWLEGNSTQSITTSENVFNWYN